MESIGRGELISLLFEDTKARITTQLCALLLLSDNSHDADLDSREIQELIGILDDGLLYIWEDQLKDIETNE